MVYAVKNQEPPADRKASQWTTAGADFGLEPIRRQRLQRGPRSPETHLQHDRLESVSGARR
jgi:hypothetical protein